MFESPTSSLQSFNPLNLFSLPSILSSREIETDKLQKKEKIHSNSINIDTEPMTADKNDSLGRIIGSTTTFTIVVDANSNLPLPHHVNSNFNVDNTHTPEGHVEDDLQRKSLRSLNNRLIKEPPNDRVLQTSSRFDRDSGCRAPLSGKFAHPCSCPPHFGSHLYDPKTRRCLSTTARRSRLLRECSRHIPCNPDLICDAKKSRCNCPFGQQIYYETNTTFGCLPDTFKCTRGSFFDEHTLNCEKSFDINELQAGFQPVLSATQFSFVSIVLLWILLLILILTAKLRKLRAIHGHHFRLNSHTSHGQGQTNASRRIRSPQNSGSSNNYYQHHHHASHLLHPFMAAAGGHRQMYYRDAERRDQENNNLLNADSEFLFNERTHNSSTQFGGSNRSLNNPPPRFEDIYPSSCVGPSSTNCFAPRLIYCRGQPSLEDLPSYEEALYMQKNSDPMNFNLASTRSNSNANSAADKSDSLTNITIVNCPRLNSSSTNINNLSNDTANNAITDTIDSNQLEGLNNSRPTATNCQQEIHAPTSASGVTGDKTPDQNGRTMV